MARSAQRVGIRPKNMHPNRKMPVAAAAEGLVDHVVRGESEQALELTCHLLKDGDVAAVEAALLRLCARFGEGAGLPHEFAVAQWRAVCADVLGVLTRNKWPVKEVVVIVAKLCVLFRGAAPVAARPPLGKMRAAVMDIFPEAAELTERGQATFARALPVDVAERAFAQRLLVGFLQLWGAEADDGASTQTKLLTATDYLLRKRELALHLPSPDWPCPNVDEYDRGDMAWFLWAIWMIKFPDTEPLWRLYSHAFKRGDRTVRVGLLLGARWLAGGKTNAPAPWSDAQLALFQRVEGYAVQMWRALTAAAAPERQPRDDVWDVLPRNGGMAHAAAAAAAHEAQEAHEPPDLKRVPIRDGAKARGDFDEYLEAPMVVHDYEDPPRPARPLRHRSGDRRLNVGETWG